jgi:hypothetical protein
MGTASSGADLSGRWTLTLDPDFSGNPDTQDCTLEQSERKLTSECDGGPPISGDVQDERVTLQFKTVAPDGRSATATMTGVVNQAGTTIKGTWHLDPDNKTGNFEYAKR